MRNIRERRIEKPHMKMSLFFQEDVGEGELIHMNILLYYKL